jgi:outer membrane protein OmpA-like peptidoglycan-associated protein
MGGLSGALNSFAPEALAQDGSGSPKGEGAMPGLGGGAVKAPSFSEIAPRLKIPDANLNPKIPEAVILRLPSDVVFDFDSATIRAEAVPLLGQAADWIAKYAVARIQVSGHTDTFGTDLYNQKLSENRARAVEEWLRQKLGSNKYTFEAKGYGKTRPIVSPKGSIAEQQANRRVEIMVQAINP